MCDELCTRCAEWKKNLIDCILGQSGDGRTGEVRSYGFLDEPHAIEGQQDARVRHRGETMLSSSVHAWEGKVTEKNKSDSNLVALGDLAQGIAQVGLTRKFVSTGDLTKQIGSLTKKPTEEEYKPIFLSSLSAVNPPQPVAKPRATKSRRKIRRRHSHGHLTQYPTIYEDRAFEDPTVTCKIVLKKRKPKPWIPPPPSTPPPPLEPISQGKKGYSSARCLLVFAVGAFVQMRRSTTLGLMFLSIPANPPRIPKKSWSKHIRIIIEQSGEISEQTSGLKSQNLHLHVDLKAKKKKGKKNSTVDLNSMTLAVGDVPIEPPIHSLLSNDVIIAENDVVEDSSGQTDIDSTPTQLQGADHEEVLSHFCSENFFNRTEMKFDLDVEGTCNSTEISFDFDAEDTCNRTETNFPIQPQPDELSETMQLQRADHESEPFLLCLESTTQLTGLKQKTCTLERASKKRRSLARNAREFLSSNDTGSSSSINSILSKEFTTEGDDKYTQPNYLLKIDPEREESFQVKLPKIFRLLSRNPISNAWWHFRSRRRKNSAAGRGSG